MKPKNKTLSPVPVQVENSILVPKKRGRPSSGVDRKTQIREAARRRRRRLRDAVGNLNVEVVRPCWLFLSDEAERQGMTVKEFVNQILFTGIQKYIDGGLSHLGPVSKGTAAAILKDWKKNPSL